MASLKEGENNKGKQRKSEKLSKKLSIPGHNVSPIAKEPVVSTTHALVDIQTTLKAINDRLDRYEPVLKSIEELKADIHETDGIEHRLKYSSQQSECNTTEVISLWSENENLKKEVDLLTSVVIRMDRRMLDMEKEITDLRSRSMRDNILIHNFQYDPREDLTTAVPEAIRQHLGINVDFIRIHRNGVRQFHGGKPITITGKLTNGNMKEKILQAQKSKKSANIRLPFYITPQDPISIVEERKRIFNKMDLMKKQNKNVKIVKNKIISQNGQQIEEDVPILNNNDILQLTRQDIEDIESVDTVMTPCVERQGSMFFGTGGEAHSNKDVTEVYKKACIHPDAACADHRILVYRFTNSDGTTSEGYHDDGEHGAGRRMLRFLQESNIINKTFVISRWYGGIHMGFERFRIMNDLLKELSNMMN